MKLTIIQTGQVPASLRDRFGPYSAMFETMFERTGLGFSYVVVRANEGEALPDAAGLEGIVITGSPAGVYEDLPWFAPLRAFIRQGYGNAIPMLGVCFGHQIMADALGGQVRKSEKGWGLGRHTYEVTARPRYMLAAPTALSIACSHQDQVIVPPSEGEVIMASKFTPNAALAYRNGAALSLQAHPEFSDDYAMALAELRRGRAPDAVVETALQSVATPSDSLAMAGYIGRFFKER